MNSKILSATGICLGLLFCQAGAFAQAPATDSGRSTKVMVAANGQFDQASPLKRLLLGDHYRKEWATLADIPILDLDGTAGGLQPVKLGGGLQTRSLRLKGANGREYVLRSVKKDPSKAIPAELRHTLAEDIVKDQISSSNPYAPMAVAELEEMAGIFHTHPRLVVVPASERLGEFAAEFAHTLCLFEERPGDNREGNADFGYASKIVNSTKMLSSVFENCRHRVDERAFLKARLFDILIGDWDRHEDQWLWAVFQDGDKTVYRPIPRDRDQAFARMDGILPQLATRKWAIRKIQHYGEEIRDLYGLAASGANLDRNFTIGLTLRDWLEVAHELQTALSDEAIDKAFHAIPDPIYALSGKQTADILKKRRNDLLKYATDYYRFLAREVDIPGTAKQEVFIVTRLNSDSTRVDVFQVNKDGQRSQPYFSRVFLRNETQELRLFGLGGDDAFELTGSVSKGILVRIAGGKGYDRYADHSQVEAPGKHTVVYDTHNNQFEKSSETRLHTANDELKNEYNRKSFRFNWLAPSLNPGYNPDDGFFIGGGVVYKKQAYGKAPFGSMQTLGAQIAPGTGAFALWYKGVYREFLGKADLQIQAKYYSPTYTHNYYGMGNETVNDKSHDADYYRTRISDFYVGTTISRKLGNHHTIFSGTGLHAYRAEQTEGRFISTGEGKPDSSVFGRNRYGQISLGYVFSTIDNDIYPSKGIVAKSISSYVSRLNGASESFGHLSAEIIFYQTAGRFTLANRGGVATNIGEDYAFYQASSLGGLDYLRGFRRDRFHGKTSAFQNTELRYRAGNFNMYVAKGTWGLLGFADHGRVWVPGETSSAWHHGYGGGLWMLPYNKMVFTITYAASKEDHLLNVGGGFLF